MSSATIVLSEEGSLKRKFSAVFKDDGPCAALPRYTTTEVEEKTAVFSQIIFNGDGRTGTAAQNFGPIQINNSCLSRTKRRCMVLDRVEISNTGSYPRSAYAIPKGSTLRPRAKAEPEIDVLQRLMEKDTGKEKEKEQGSHDPIENTFISYKLDNFCIYRSKAGKRYDVELTPLSYLNNRSVQTLELQFDGTIIDSHNSSGYYVEGVLLKAFSVGNYLDKGLHDIDGAIWIQSPLSSKRDVWYELQNPSKEYFRYFEKWLFGFAKHVIDYVDENVREDQAVSLENFRSDFYAWLLASHGVSKGFQRWLSEYGHKDFRQAVSVYSDYLWSQMYQTEPKYCEQSFFREVHLLNIIQPSLGTSIGPQKTVVTPYVFRLFEHIFGPYMKAVSLKTSSLEGRHNNPLKPLVIIPVAKPSMESINVGDFIFVKKDDATVWKGSQSKWLAYVLGIRKTRWGQQYEVVWCYRAEDTLCAGMKYPYEDEIFFSDHCNHGSPLIPHDEVLEKVSVSLFKRSPYTRYFIRSKYVTDDNSFQTLRVPDFQSCACLDDIEIQKAKKGYKPGDAVLVKSVFEGVDILEPVIVEGFDDDAQLVFARFLMRRSRFEPDRRPNELVWTEKLTQLPAESIVRTCHIRFVPEKDVLEEKLPELYELGGSFDMFFISCKATHEGVEPFTEGTFPKINPGIDVADPPCEPLRGIDLFCGGGSLGRGLEEGGHVVKNVCAVDINVAAMHTYRANLNPENQNCNLYLGSVNDFLEMAIKGDLEERLRPENIDFLAAGSPCQGFSTANAFKTGDKSMRNSSLVASVASFVEVYKPKYALLENVLGLATTRKKENGESYNVYSQLLCALVGLGYQVRQFPMDAWSHGSAQNRTRVFVMIAAPGLKLPARPPCTHRHPEQKRKHHITRAPNGLLICGRDFTSCPFPPRTSHDILKDLPRLGDGHPNFCVPFPDHICSRSNNNIQRSVLAYLPKRPGIFNSYQNACKLGFIPIGIRSMMPIRKKDWDHHASKSWSRIKGDGLCRTITTTIQPSCNFTGTWVHYDEPRLLTVMEARRVQSIPDHEVLVGNSIADHFRIVGNGVDRMVARALGLSIREALEHKA